MIDGSTVNGRPAAEVGGAAWRTSRNIQADSSSDMGQFGLTLAIVL